MPSNLSRYIPQYVPKVVPLQIVDDLYTLKTQYPFLFLGFSTVNDIKASTLPLVDSENVNELDTLLKTWALNKMINAGGLFGMSSELELETMKLPAGSYNLPATETIVPGDDPDTFDMGIQPIEITDNNTSMVYNNLELPDNWKADMKHISIHMGLFSAPTGGTIYENTFFNSKLNPLLPLTFTGTDKVTVANDIVNWINNALAYYQGSEPPIVQGTANISVTAGGDGIITVAISNLGAPFGWKDKADVDINNPIETYIFLTLHHYKYPDAYALILENNIKS